MTSVASVYANKAMNYELFWLANIVYFSYKLKKVSDILHNLVFAHLHSYLFCTRILSELFNRLITTFQCNSACKVGSFLFKPECQHMT